MTLPSERFRSVLATENFLEQLTRPKETPGVPLKVRQMAGLLLRHYPTAYDMRVVAIKAPDVFEDSQR